MEPHTNPEDEYFARLEGEMERERERREAVRKELNERQEIAPLRAEDLPPVPQPVDASEAQESRRGSKIVATVSHIIKTMFGLKTGRTRHA